jgi:DNA excision repair protein ERCC-4
MKKPIIADTREKKSGRPTSLRRRRCKVEIEQLDVGDYLVGKATIEYKTGADFIASIRDKRIWNQASNLAQAEHPIIAVVSENIWKQMYFTRSNYIHKTFFTTLTKLTTSFGITVLMFTDEDDFLRYVKSIYKQQDKESSGVRPAPLQRKATKFCVRQENNLCTAKGISVKTAKKILRHFGSVKRVANATVKQLTKVDGIGEGKAKEVYKVFNEMYKED